MAAAIPATPLPAPLKVTDFGTNRKLIYDILLVLNTNLAPILHRFQDIALKRSKIAIWLPLLV